MLSSRWRVERLKTKRCRGRGRGSRRGKRPILLLGWRGRTKECRVSTRVTNDGEVPAVVAVAGNPGDLPGSNSAGRGEVRTGESWLDALVRNLVRAVSE